MVCVPLIEVSLVRVALSLFVMLGLRCLLFQWTANSRSVKFMGIAGILPFSWVFN